jgi:hypothetical protein
MSDNKKWFKVWASILNDPTFLNMSLENIGRWTLLGAMICQQGDNGKLQVLPPSKLLALRFGVDDFDALKMALKVLPNVHLIDCHPANDGFIVTLKNWYKYQVDSTSGERVKRIRYKRRGEEKRSRTSTSTSPATSTSRSASPPAPFRGGGSQAQTSGGENGAIRGKSIFRPDDDQGPTRNGQPGGKELAPGEILARVRNLPKV